MNRFVVTTIFLFSLMIVNSAWAFSCSDHDSLEVRFQKSERVFVVLITDTRLEESLFEKLQSDSQPKEDPDAVKLISSGYRVIENFKGNNDHQPRFLELMGISLGYVGFAPGSYYLMFLPPTEENLIEGMRALTHCEVGYSHYRLNVKKFQMALDQVRAIKGESITKTLNTKTPPLY